MALFEKALNGVVNLPMELQNGKTVNTDVNFLAWFESPVQDLRSVMPATWNACDTAATFRDKTMGGLLPSGNADQILVQECGR